MLTVNSQTIVCLLHCFYIGEKMMVYNKSIYSTPPPSPPRCLSRRIRIGRGRQYPIFVVTSDFNTAILRIRPQKPMFRVAADVAR